MGLKRREFSKEFKLQIITEVEAGKPMSQVGREHQVNATTIAKWRKQLRQYKDQAFAGNGHAYSDEARTAELERMVGRLTMENDLLKKALRKLGALGATSERERKRAMVELIRAETKVHEQSGTPHRLSVARMCHVLLCDARRAVPPTRTACNCGCR